MKMRKKNKKRLSLLFSILTHKRTWQGVSAILLPYLYKLHIVHTTNNYSYSNVHASFMSTPLLWTKTLRVG